MARVNNFRLARACGRLLGRPVGCTLCRGNFEAMIVGAWTAPPDARAVLWPVAQQTLPSLSHAASQLTPPGQGNGLAQGQITMATPPSK